jgi:hypothetical protein
LLMKIRDGLSVRPLPPKFVIEAVKRWDLEDEIAQGCYRHIGIADGKELIGLATMYPGHPYKPNIMFLEHIRYKPGLSTRRMIEAAATLGREVGAKTQLVGFSRRHDYKFFTLMKNLGVLRKVGKQSAGFETMVTVWETPKSLLDA